MPYRTMEVVVPKRPEWGFAEWCREVWMAGPKGRAYLGLLILSVYVVLCGVSLLFVPSSQTISPSWEELRAARTSARYQDCVRRQGTWHMGQDTQWCSIDLRRSR